MDQPWFRPKKRPAKLNHVPPIFSRKFTKGSFAAIGKVQHILKWKHRFSVFLSNLIFSFFSLWGNKSWKSLPEGDFWPGNPPRWPVWITKRLNLSSKVPNFVIQPSHVGRFPGQNSSSGSDFQLLHASQAKKWKYHITQKYGKTMIPF